jgi:hypothetical protein
MQNTTRYTVLLVVFTAAALLCSTIAFLGLATVAAQGPAAYCAQNQTAAPRGLLTDASILATFQAIGLVCALVAAVALRYFARSLQYTLIDGEVEKDE